MFAIFRLWFVMFYPASVLFRFLVVVDAYEEQVAGKLRELFGIPPFFDLPDGGVGCFVVLEFDQYDRFAVGVCRDKRHVNEAFAAWQFFHGDKTACGSDVGVAHECAQRLLVVVEPGGGVLVVQRVQCLGYIRFVHGQRGFQQQVRLFDELY